MCIHFPQIFPTFSSLHDFFINLLQRTSKYFNSIQFSIMSPTKRFLFDMNWPKIDGATASFSIIQLVYTCMHSVAIGGFL